jgi:hypothetical protein
MHWRIRNPLPKPLMGSGLFEGEDIRLEKAVELLRIEDQVVIQAFSPQASQKAFTHGIRPVRVRHEVGSTLMPLVVATRAKCAPNFRSLSRIRYLGVCPYGAIDTISAA